ncbi:MAG: hypothetical protein Q8P56_04200 [Candidatus Uhrbacteria bacterium]|nr:hypothetical protein [Candidatus Uhrbacteria bacterium]
MNYFFIPGRIPSLSLCELFESCRTKNLSLELGTVSGVAFLAGLAENGDTASLFYSLGGMIKYGVIVGREKSLDAAFSFISNDLITNAPDSKKRTTFGISSYTVPQKGQKENPRTLSFTVQRAGIEIKKEFVREGASVRFVSPQKGECALSSVVVEKNHLLEEGNVEWVLIRDGDTWHIGKTHGVQEFEQFSKRDWNRPHRDMEVGLLPPKLARMMINLSGTHQDALLLDPFCGLGTVLQEASLLGYTAIFGSDLEQKQIDATRENLEWLTRSTQNHSTITASILKKCDARAIARCFPNTLFDAIITEPFLGPVMRERATTVNQKTIKDLCALYIDSFREWKKILKKGSRVVVVLPVWIFRDKKTFMPCLKEIEKLGYTNKTIPPELTRFIQEKTDRNSIIVAREDQHVGRELFVLEN